MNEDKDFQIGDVVIVSDQDHALFGTVFKVVEIFYLVELEFLPEYNPDKIEKWEKRPTQTIGLFRSRLSLYGQFDINFLE